MDHTPHRAARAATLATARATALATALAAVVLAGTGAAHADATTKSDARGDAPAALDVTKVEFRYDTGGVHARVHVADLQPEGEFVLAVSDRPQSLRFGLVATGHADGSVTRTFYRYSDGVLTERDCRGSRVRWSESRDTVTMSFPERCFRALGARVRVGVGSSQAFPTGATVDEGPTSVLWAPASWQDA